MRPSPEEVKAEHRYRRERLMREGRLTNLALFIILVILIILTLVVPS